MTIPTAFDFDQLDAELRERADADSEFIARLSPIIAMLASQSADSLANPSLELSLAVGAAGIALHMDDKASGRWSPTTTEDPS